MQNFRIATLWPLFSIAIFFSITLGCKKDMALLRQGSVQIEEAKGLFEKWRSQQTLNAKERTDSTLWKEPLWNLGVNYYDSLTQSYILEVPIQANYSFTYVSRVGNNALVVPPGYGLPSKRSLIMVRDAQGNINLAVCNIMAGTAYFLSGKNNNFNTYRFKDPAFEGVVLFTDWNDNFLQGYPYKNGNWNGERIIAYGLSQNDSITETRVNDRWEECELFFDIEITPIPCPPMEGGVSAQCWQVCYNGLVGADCQGVLPPTIFNIYDPTWNPLIPGPNIINPGTQDPNPGYFPFNYNPNPDDLDFNGKVNYFYYQNGIYLWTNYDWIAEECNNPDYQIFEECVKNKLIDALLASNPVINLTQQERSWLKNHFELFANIQNFLDANGSNMVAQKMVDDLIYLAAQLNLTTEQARWLLVHPAATQGIAEFQSEYQGFDGVVSASQMYIAYLIENQIDNPLEGDFANYGENASSCGPCFVVAWTVEHAVLKRDHPGPNPVSNPYAAMAHAAKLQAWATWNVSSTGVHLLLDIGGLFPVAGEIADLASGGIYILEGEYVDASLSFSASIPIGGWVAFGTKYARKIVTVGGKSATLNMVVVNGIIKFGKNVNEGREQLRRVLNTPAAQEAHHIVPWELREHPVVQAAASVGNNSAFHMNEILNGISLPKTLGNSGLPQHLGSHPDYTERVRQSLNAIETQLGSNMNPTDALDKLTVLVGEINTKIKTTSGGTINAVSGW